MNDRPNPNPKPGAQPDVERYERAPDPSPISPRKILTGAIVVLLILAVFAVIGILRRMHAHTVLKERTYDLAAPTVTIAPARPGAPVDNFVLPGNVTAYTDAPIYARTDGYLVRWYYDIGSKVKKGAVLATIDTPELDKQVAQAESDLATAQANANIARLQADRYTALVKSEAVSQQDADTYVNQATATAAEVRSAQDNVQRVKELQSFEKVYAPFDGVVTARTVDTGQLINQGSGAELFHMQAIETLRVYTNVPEAYAQTLQRGMKINLTFPEHPGKIYVGTLVRTADAIDPASRTLLAEVDVNNRSGELLPGSLAQVHFKTPTAGATFIVPTAALIFRRDGLELAKVVDGDKARMVHVVIGEDDGATVQIVDGLHPGDKIIQDPPDSLIDGEKVDVVQPGSMPSPAGEL
ncbi:MAG: efflux RND transporter periplasmic adaptor subunit [Terracidiphilus sp.]|jgi:RND family efflux transporter MFP subunit